MSDIKVTEQNNKIILEGVHDFDPVHTFECGQCFRWNREQDGSYTGVAFSKVINLKKDGDIVIVDNCCLADFQSIWHDYFDFGRNYGIIKEALSQSDPVMEKAVRFGHGIRILNQDEWETIISFILSQNRSIPIIKQSIEAICRKYGSFIGTYRNREYYAFPTPEALAQRTAEELADCKAGYRAKYVVETAKAVLQAKDIGTYRQLDSGEIENRLLGFSGVGPKVANCIMLFSMKKTERFPVDVWIKRIMAFLYPDNCRNENSISKYAAEKYGQYGGFAQQYLFYYARENSIGR